MKFTTGNTALAASFNVFPSFFSGRLQKYDGSITAQGKLLHKGPLSVLDTFSNAQNANSSTGPPKMKDFNCFLFEQSMIFAETVGKKTTQTSYYYEYKAHFLVSQVLFFKKKMGLLKLICLYVLPLFVFANLFFF